MARICEEYYITTRKPCRYKSKILRGDGKRVCLIHEHSYTMFRPKQEEISLDPPSDPIDIPIDPPINNNSGGRVRGPRPLGSKIGKSASRVVSTSSSTLPLFEYIREFDMEIRESKKYIDRGENYFGKHVKIWAKK